VWSGRVFWLLAAFLAWAALATAAGIHLPTSIFGSYKRYDGLLAFILYAGVFFLAVQTIETPAQVRSLARTVGIAGAAVGIHGTLQHLGLDPVDWGGPMFEGSRAFSTFGNPDLLGGYLLFPLLLLPALALSQPRVRLRVLWWPAFVFVGVAWLATFSRGAWIGGFAGLVLLAVACGRRRCLPGRRDALPGLVAVAALGAVVIRSLGSATAVTDVGARLESMLRLGEGSVKTRLEIWSGALRAIADRPVLGFGPDSFRLAFPPYRPAAYVADAGRFSFEDSAHNYPLHLAAGVGVPGALLLFAFFGAILGRAAPAVFGRDGDGAALARAGFWVASAAYLVHLLFGPAVVGSSVLLWVALGVLARPYAAARAVPAVARGTGARVAAAVLGLVLVGLSVLPVAADRAFLRAHYSGDLQERVQIIEWAIALNPFVEAYRPAIGKAYLTAASPLLPAPGARPDGAEPDEQEATGRAVMHQAAAAFERARRYSPRDSESYINLAIVNNWLGGRDPAYYTEAVRVVGEELAWDPHEPLGRYQRGFARLQLGDLEAAERDAREAAELDPSYTDAWLLLGDVALEQNRPAEARQAFERALTTAPGDERIVRALDRLQGAQ